MNPRVVNRTDASALAALHARSFAKPWSASEFTDLLAQGEVFGMMDVEGFILIRIAGGEAEVLTLAVTPERRRQGLGRSLLTAAQTLARSRGIEALFLEVAADNAAAVALYKGAGFEQVGRRRGYYAGPDGAVDALVLRCDLNSQNA
jgi:ribosomal-protein-alanine N-acetyltransferase